MAVVQSRGYFGRYGVHDIRNNDDGRQDCKHGIDKRNVIIVHAFPHGHFRIVQQQAIIPAFGKSKEQGEQKHHYDQPMGNGDVNNNAPGNYPQQET